MGSRTLGKVYFSSLLGSEASAGHSFIGVPRQHGFKNARVRLIQEPILDLNYGVNEEEDSC